VYLNDFSESARRCRDSEFGFAEFRADSDVAALGWPDDVLEQLLFDHASNAAFLDDYGRIDLATVGWDVKVVALADLLVMPTGASDADCIDEYAANPDHWVRVRNSGIHLGVSECWETHGTWKRWPILIDRELLDPVGTGLQLVEGRTRVGVLRGRYRTGRFVAPRHLAWVGRAR